MPTGSYIRIKGSRKPCSKETKRKISEAHRGMKASEEARLHIGEASKGRVLSEESRRKMSELHKGSKSYLWKGGINPINDTIRKSLDFKLWREVIFTRDNWTCQKCGQKGRKLNPHHIFNFATCIDRRFDILNGITLCEDCHKEFHRIYDKKNNTKEQLIEFLMHEEVQKC